MEIKNIISSTSYLAPIKYIQGRIVEYDIKSANINTLLQSGKIDKAYYDYLSKLPKFEREKEIGLLIRGDKDYYDKIKEGIIEAKTKLASYNNLQPHEIIRIANDAVYVNRPIDLAYTSFGNIEFKKKSIYSSILNIKEQNLLILFFIDSIGNINIDVKGIGEDNLKFHQDYLLSVIGTTMYLLERSTVENALNFITDFHENYINLELPIEYYREFNNFSMYRIKNSIFYMTNAASLDDIDIGYNLYIIRCLWSIVLERFNNRR